MAANCTDFNRESVLEIVICISIVSACQIRLCFLSLALQQKHRFPNTQTSIIHQTNKMIKTTSREIPEITATLQLRSAMPGRSSG